MSNRDRELNENGEDSKYVMFLKKRLAECMEDNQRYHAKYVYIREFAYTSLESLMRQLNSKRRNTV